MDFQDKNIHTTHLRTPCVSNFINWPRVSSTMAPDGISFLQVSDQTINITYKKSHLKTENKIYNSSTLKIEQRIKRQAQQWLG